MEEPTLSSTIRRFQKEKTDVYAAFALLFYTSFVYVWALTIHPLGPDYAPMADPARAMSPVVAWIFSAETALFGAWAIPYHAINAALLYGCAVFVYRIGRETIFAPAWLSLLAAVFYMANPIHRDAVFLVSGLDASIPAVVTLAAAFFGVRACRMPTLQRQAAAAVAMALAFALFDNARALAIPILLAIWLVPKHQPPADAPAHDGPKRPLLLLVVSGVLAAIQITLWLRHFEPRDWDIATMWPPLYFALYPLGFLPETIRQFHTTPWLAWLSGALAALMLLFIARKAKSRVLVWAILSALAMRLGQANTPFDVVHLLGGRHLLVANAFVLLGLCEVFHRMVRHPKWHRAVVTGTTIGCLVLFGMQIYAAFVWRGVGNEVRAFQESLNDAPDEPIGLLPDVGYYRGAPAFFAESLRYNTPFSRGHDVRGLSMHNVRDADAFRATPMAYAPHEATLDLECGDLGYALGHPYTIDARETETTTVGVLDGTSMGGRLVIRPKDGTLPTNYQAPVK